MQKILPCKLKGVKFYFNIPTGYVGSVKWPRTLFLVYQSWRFYLGLLDGMCVLCKLDHSFKFLAQWPINKQVRYRNCTFFECISCERASTRPIVQYWSSNGSLGLAVRTALISQNFLIAVIIKRQKPQAPTPQAPIRNRQTRIVANAKGLNRNTDLT